MRLGEGRAGSETSPRSFCHGPAPGWFQVWMTSWRCHRATCGHSSNIPGPPGHGAKPGPAWSLEAAPEVGLSSQCQGPTYLHGVISVGENVQEVG